MQERSDLYLESVSQECMIAALEKFLKILKKKKPQMCYTMTVATNQYFF